jgi:uncharacterized UPF0160 family protein
VREYNVTSIIFSFLPQDENENPDDNFIKAVNFAKELLTRNIKSAKQEALDSEELLKLAKRTTGAVLVLERFLRGKDALADFPGILYVVYPGNRSWGNNQWYVKAVRKNADSFESKKLFPSEWGGKTGSDLETITGVKGAIFCHKGRHLATADTKEGVLALADKAVNA